MLRVFNNISVEGMASAVPSAVEKNDEASAILGERRCKKQIKLTGIYERRVSLPEQKISDLCYIASKKLIEHLDWDIKDIKILVLLTQHPDFMIPSTAFYIQKLLGMSDDSIVFDVNMGCSAFNIGLDIVSGLLQQFPDGSKALCMQGDLAYKIIKEDLPPDDMASMMLFGSGASVFALQKKENVSEVCCQSYSYGSKYDAIIRAHGDCIHMDGTEVYNFSTNYVVEKIKSFKESMQIDDHDVDYYAFHQAQKLILDSIRIDLGILDTKELRSLDKYGNTSGASIPISVCANKGWFATKDSINLLTCGFGVGLSCSIGYFKIATSNILPVIDTDYVHEEIRNW